MRSTHFHTRHLTDLVCTLLCVACMLLSCANPGSGPDVGPYYETPPRIVQMLPALGNTGERARKVTIAFDEPVKIDNASEKVIVSPPQINMP